MAMNKLSTDIIKEKVPFTWGQFIGIVVFAVTSTFTLTTIYSRFELVESNQEAFELRIKEEMIILKGVILKNDKDQTRRLDTKTSRNAEEIKFLKK